RGTVTSDDSPDARARPAVARRAAAHRRHSRTDGGRVRIGRVLRLLAPPRPPHTAWHRVRLSTQPESGGGSARRLLQPAVGDRALLRVHHRPRRSSHPATHPTGVPPATERPLRALPLGGRLLAPADGPSTPDAGALCGGFPAWGAHPGGGRLSAGARVCDEPPRNP